MSRRRLSAEAYITGILDGDRVVLGRAISLVESNLSADQELAERVIAGLMPRTGASYRIGITGVPGVGKSTFIDAFGTYLTGLRHRVAVLAVDPSSGRSRGSILGDKTRMQRLSHDPRAFIRPSPNAGSLGGITRRSREVLLLCEAAGFDVVIVETVGVGQSETAVHAMTDAFVLLMLPGAGDELQGIKKGVMEMADLLVVNKADGSLLPNARIAKTTYSQALRLFPKHPSGWRPPVMLSSATEEKGIDAVWEHLLNFQKTQRAGAFWDDKRRAQRLRWFNEAVESLLGDTFRRSAGVAEMLPRLEAEVEAEKLSPVQAARRAVAIFQRDTDPNSNA